MAAAFRGGLAGESQILASIRMFDASWLSLGHGSQEELTNVFRHG